MRRSWSLRYGAYHVPQLASSDVEDARYYHEDLTYLDEITLTAELLAATSTLARLRGSRHVVGREWLVERHAQLQTVLRRLHTAQPQTEGPPT
jgi:hypothetical protein